MLNARRWYSYERPSTAVSAKLHCARSASITVSNAKPPSAPTICGSARFVGFYCAQNTADPAVTARGHSAKNTCSSAQSVKVPFAKVAR